MPSVTPNRDEENQSPGISYVSGVNTPPECLERAGGVRAPDAIEDTTEIVTPPSGAWGSYTFSYPLAGSIELRNIRPLTIGMSADESDKPNLVTVEVKSPIKNGSFIQVIAVEVKGALTEKCLRSIEGYEVGKINFAELLLELQKEIDENVKQTKSNRLECVSCGKSYLETNMVKDSRGNPFCIKDGKKFLFNCSNCHRMCQLPFHYNSEEKKICTRCKEQMRECTRCHRPHTHNTNVCSVCRMSEMDVDSIPVKRPWRRGVGKFCSKDIGPTIKDYRIFSAELECHYPNDAILKKVAKNLLPIETGISGDGSLGDRGIEFQTPLLSGNKGEEYIKSVCGVLLTNGFTADSKKAGLHIHLDTSDISEDGLAILYVFLFYILFEDVIRSFLPSSRRRNRYCLSVKRSYNPLSLIEMVKGLRYETDELPLSQREKAFKEGIISELEKYWYKNESAVAVQSIKAEKYTPSRYYGVNFHSLFKDGHLEIRYHSGTLNSKKILEWVKLHQAIIKWGIVLSQGTSYTDSDERLIDILDEVDELVTLEDKTEYLLEKLNLGNESKKYFLSRQKLFSPVKSATLGEKELEANESTNPCAA